MKLYDCEVNKAFRCQILAVGRAFFPLFVKHRSQHCETFRNQTRHQILSSRLLIQWMPCQPASYLFFSIPCLASCCSYPIIESGLIIESTACQVEFLTFSSCLISFICHSVLMHWNSWWVRAVSASAYLSAICAAQSPDGLGDAPSADDFMRRIWARGVSVRQI